MVDQANGRSRPGLDPDQFSLDARYTTLDGTVMLTGVQALARVIIDHLRDDRAAGLRTAAFVSGYPGSPLGGFDQALERSVHDVEIRHVPGLNEELAATAVWGSQQDNLATLDGRDGVVGLWYGKSPGLDRCGDVLRHANQHGVGHLGGVVLAVGDDPSSKSSTLPGACEAALFDLGVPVLAPGTVDELLHLGRHAVAMSRFSGLWAGLKITTAVADAFASISVTSTQLDAVLPTEVDGVAWVHRQRPRFFIPDTIELEEEVHRRRLPAAEAYARANGLNRIHGTGSAARLGIVATGRTFVEVRQALTDLGLDEQALERAGVRLLQLGMTFPLDQDIVVRFAEGLSDIVVIEEKRSFVEMLLRNVLYGRSNAPRIHGKALADGRRLIPMDSELTADRIKPALRIVFGEVLDPPVPVRADRRFTDADAGSLVAVPVQLQVRQPATRTAAFCSGCPHNRSTVNATDSSSGGGVGCHALVMWMDRGASSYTQMGGEGAQWIGRAPFVREPHFVQNMGDGTFFHSGSLAVRFAVAAGVNTTFKLLYNGVVAMTGGQDPTGGIPVPELCTTLLAEGVQRIVVVAEDPGRYRRGRFRPGTTLPAGVELRSRDDLDDVQRELAATEGVTILVYDQACANELRRLRKRGKAPQRSMRVVINEAVCEGCGDCGRTSNCLSVHPVDTELGRKTQIHQSSCNTDYTCLDGDCPSFVTVHVDPRAPAQAPVAPTTPAFTDELPADPQLPSVPADGYGVYITGIGGTGVVTLNQVLATAAAFDGLSVSGLDQTGLSQKGGPVVSHLKMHAVDRVGSPVVGDGAADVAIALDLLVSTDPRHLARLDRQRTRTVACTSVVPTTTMVTDTNAQFGDVDELVDLLRQRSVTDGIVTVDAVGISQAMFGEHMPANLVALGSAFQMGALPVTAASLERAIEANGVAVDRSRAAFRAGRLAVADPARLTSLLTQRRAGDITSTASAADRAAAERLVAATPLSSHPLAGLITHRTAELVAHQSARWARRYLDVVADVAEREQHAEAGSISLTDAVARQLHRLMAYKDEYEVARLHLLLAATTERDRLVPSANKVRYRLHPPVLKALGMKRKIALPPLVARPTFVVLRSMRRLRGTPFDPFARSAMRRLERQLIDEYVRLIGDLTVAPGTIEHATLVAGLADMIRGYEELKMHNVAAYRAAVAAITSPEQMSGASSTGPMR